MGYKQAKTLNKRKDFGTSHKSCKSIPIIFQQQQRNIRKGFRHGKIKCTGYSSPGSLGLLGRHTLGDLDASWKVPSLGTDDSRSASCVWAELNVNIWQSFSMKQDGCDPAYGRHKNPEKLFAKPSLPHRCARETSISRKFDARPLRAYISE